jgi:ATP-dependent helicase HrpA
MSIAIHYPEDLPVSQRRDEILAALRQHQVVIVCGETGSGKTTQLPKMALQVALEREAAGHAAVRQRRLIGCTQPRRIAARSIASRLGVELRDPDLVGFKVRFTDTSKPGARLKVMTDGILLAETRSDPDLRAYGTLLIDEAHERSLNIDFLLGYLKRLCVRRPDLKLIVTSATIDAQRFSRHFEGAPVIEVSGRTYPVEVRYRPLPKDADDSSEAVIEGIVDAVDELARVGDGDVLVFLPGEREIRETAEALRKHHPPGAEILPLFARLSAAEQNRVFQPGGARRIVLSTNVAETSLTVPGIRYVVDPGLARVNRYSYRNKVEMLLTERVSQASANQRAGRCGRVAAGVCIRLYEEEDYRTRPPFSDPEIARASLASVILRMAALRLGAVEDFPFLEAPSARAIHDGYQQLQELGAVDEQRQITPLGEEMARLPLDPAISRLILAARDEQCLKEVLVIAGALSVQDPRERPIDRAGAADDAHRAFADERSDFMGLLKLWQWYDDALRHKKSNRQLASDCKTRFLSPLRLREWRDIHGQLHALLSETGLRENQQPGTFEQIHRALLAGLLGNIGVKTETPGEYQGARGNRFWIFPGSALHRKGGKWVLAAELVETSKLYARVVASIQPEWIEQVAAPLLKRQYIEPHWDAERGEVMAWERVTLFGLTLVNRRKARYGPVDPAEAHQIFLRQALVAGSLQTHGSFLRHNAALRQELEELEHMSRRVDVLVDDDAVHAHFARVVPRDICDARAFERWRRDAEQKDPRILYLTRETLMRHTAAAVTAQLFPRSCRIDGVECRYDYRFEPGHPADGVTLSVPLHLLNRLDAHQGEWLVPGLLREKLTLLVKALPKALRRVCVPVPDCVTAALEALDDGQGELLPRLAAHLSLRYRIEVSASSFAGVELPAHLRLRYRIVDDGGQELAEGRELPALRTQLAEAARLTFAKSDEPEMERSGIRTWDLGDLPAEIAFSRGGRRLVGYPALVDEGDAVALRLFDTAEAAAASHRVGVCRLLRLELRDAFRQWEKSLPGFQALALQARTLCDADALREDWLAAVADRALLGEDEPPRTQLAFQEQKQRGRTRLPAVVEAVGRIATACIGEWQAIQTALSRPLPQPLRADLQAQTQRLVFKGFLATTPWAHLQHLPRYLKAISRRLERFAQNPARDEQHRSNLAALWAQYEQRLARHRKAGIEDPHLQDYRWLLEELRVSLFAQELRTPFPVSYKRLEKHWAQVRP